MNRTLTAYYDIGTTNMRLFLLDETLALLDSRRAALGAKDAAVGGGGQTMLLGMKRLYDALLAETGRRDEEVREIYASGMATSPYGICEIPHFLAPVSAEEFACRGVTRWRDETVFHRDIQLVAGLKTLGRDISTTNNTRGEEIEVLGVLPELGRLFPGREVAVILPGSHTHALLAGRGKLLGILSNFTGELFHAIGQDTILAPVLAAESQHPDPDAVRLGMENLRHYGFNRALYIGHAMRVFNEGSAHSRRCYCEAVISGGVIQALDAVCREQWTRCDTALVVANPYMAELFSLLLEQSHAIRRHDQLILADNKSYGLEGLREILRIRKEMAL